MRWLRAESAAVRRARGRTPPARLRWGLIFSCLSLCALPLRADEFQRAFDQANALYYEGKFAEASAAYEKLIQAGHRSASLYFNLGNARFKADENGRAMAAYRQAEHLAPRDPSVRFNLQFTRKRVTGSEVPGVAVWQRSLSVLTLNEWTVLAVGGYWLWFLLLSLRECSAPLRRALRGYTSAAGVTAVLLGGCLAAAAYEEGRITGAVVVVPNAVVRYGPLEKSDVHYQLRDGSEVAVLDEKHVSDPPQVWLQVRDPALGVGWLKLDQVAVLKF
jgi:tetratricopeptide (TPR) repeat protein